MMSLFDQRLRQASQTNDSMLCVGLDPDPKYMRKPQDVVAFNYLLIEATQDIACAYKPNLALYESFEFSGQEALRSALDTIRQLNPLIPIIGDAKRGDIGNCGEAYAKTLFEEYTFDAVTVNPYMGKEAVDPFLRYEDKGIYVLCRTSNPGGKDLQELTVVGHHGSGPHPLYEAVAQLAHTWNGNGNVGLVVGATYPEQMSRIRNICPNMNFLIPGIGFQGGDLFGTVKGAIDNKGGGFTINASRQIMYAAFDNEKNLLKDASDRMRQVALGLRDKINEYMKACEPCLPAPS